MWVLEVLGTDPAHPIWSGTKGPKLPPKRPGRTTAHTANHSPGHPFSFPHLSQRCLQPESLKASKATLSSRGPPRHTTSGLLSPHSHDDGPLFFNIRARNPAYIL